MVEKTAQSAVFLNEFTPAGGWLLAQPNELCTATSIDALLAWSASHRLFRLTHSHRFRLWRMTHWVTTRIVPLRECELLNDCVVQYELSADGRYELFANANIVVC